MGRKKVVLVGEIREREERVDGDGQWGVNEGGY